jgi:RNA polymerase sigma-70 factor (ECF subfamily)
VLTAKSGVEDASLPIVAGPQRISAAKGSERQREFENILSQDLSRYRKIAMRMLGNLHDAEDALQDALLSAFTHVGGFDGRAQMSTWLTKIVINAARMQIRRRDRRQTLSLDDSANDGQCITSEWLLDPSPSPEQTLERRQLRELAINLIAGLPASQKATLNLHQRDDFSIKMAAETLGVPEGTIKAQLTRGRANLTERFQQATRRTKPQTTLASNLGANTKARSSPYGKRFAHNSPQMPIVVLNQHQGACAAWVA